MAIQFQCPYCRHAMQLRDTDAGEQVVCPRCSKRSPLIRTEPKPSASRPSPGFVPLADGNLDSVVSLGLSPLEPADTISARPIVREVNQFGSVQSGGNNPFAASTAPRSASPPVPASHARPMPRNLTGAEIATMICGGLLIAYAVVQMVVVLVMFMTGSGMYDVPQETREQFAEDAAFAVGFAAGQFIAFLLSFVVMLAILAGGIQMIRFKVWGLCLTACILTIMPCSPICLLGMPIGIWGIVMLSLSQVKSAYR